MISFHVCSFCLKIKHLITTSANPQDKNRYIIAKRIHTLRYKEFFNALKKKEDNVMVLSYDCQKNHVLPKVPDQSAYYSRQLYTCNFTVCRGTSKDSLGNDNVYIYNWLENEFPKGCNEIASSVFHNLKTVPIPPNVTKVRLFADGCGGQNKNTVIVGMASKWLQNHAPEHVTHLEFYFPVVGHSFLPPDRVFARIEKRTRKKEEIILPEEYIRIFEEHGTVIRLGGKECVNFDWKNAMIDIQKKPGVWHFKFNQCKRFILKYNRSANTISVRGEANYRTDLCRFKSVLKSGKSYESLDPQVILPGRQINQAKLKDVEKLVKTHFGDDWQEQQQLMFYKDLVHGQREDLPEEEDQDLPEENMCADTHNEDPCELQCV